ncbi:unnamed protein product [Rhizoctonia solani]|uniref:Uncharacterized protein n=1 Tax=Rhizoctonia solani TaxID=456999 RepID=A0A8H2X7V0_9AGAM|nr:unnamed protein product [Rhizoctonia solani]
MSPSLTAIHLTAKADRYHYMTLPTASTLLRHAVSNCPNLHKLSLVALERYMERTPTDLSTALTFWEPSYYDSLSSLPLRELCCGANLLLPANIHALVELQFLERLELHSVNELLNLNAPSPEMLPLLNTLILVAVNWCDIISILKLNVYSGVKSLTIRMSETYHDEVSSLDDEPIMSLTVLIAFCCPTLNNLEIDCGNDHFFSLEDISVLQALAGLPLHSVSLINISVPSSMLEKLVSLFPLASTIRIPDSLLGLADLHYFSQPPNLVHLAIRLSVSLGTSIPPQPLQVDSMFKVASNFQILEIASSPTKEMVDLSPLARYLLSVWPNLKQVIWTDGLEPGEEDPERNTVIENALNTLISIYQIISTSNI